VSMRRDNFWSKKLQSFIRESQKGVRGRQARRWKSKEHSFLLLRGLLHQHFMMGGYRCRCGRKMRILSRGEIAAICTAMAVLRGTRD